MTILPSQKLSTGEFFVSVAVGLMFFLLPNDAENQFTADHIQLSYVFIAALLITVVLFFFIKKYEAIGCALFSFSLFEAVGVAFEIINGFFSKGKDYWALISEYDIVSLFFLWMTPFVFAVCFRLVASGDRDSNAMRRSFSKFMVLSMRALLIIYIIVFIFKLILPERPHLEDERAIELGLLQRINACANGTHENGGEYLIWHCIILAPFAFYLSVMVPKLRIWHIIIMAAALGLTVEALQYSLNTSTACTDDMIMYIIGAGLGMIVKYFIDFLRLLITDGEEPYMLSFEYTPKKTRPKDQPEMMIDE